MKRNFVISHALFTLFVLAGPASAPVDSKVFPLYYDGVHYNITSEPKGNPVRSI